MASETYKTLVERMGAVYAELKALVDGANATDGGMDPAAEQKYSSLKAQYASLTAQRQRNEELMGMEQGAKFDAPEAPALITRATGGEYRRPTYGYKTTTSSPELTRAWENYYRLGEHTNPGDMREIRALSEASGGDTLAPIEYHNQLAAKMKTMTAVRQVSKVIQVGSFSREIAIESVTGTANWTAEAGTFSESGSTFGKITLTPRKLTGLLKVSNELIEDAPARGAGFSIESILVEQFARMFAQAEELGFLASSAVTNGPQSPIMAQTTGNDKTCASATTFTAAEVIAWIYTLPRQYRQNASIITSDAVLGVLRGLASIASGTVNYFWQNSNALGEPDRLMGIPVYASAAMPAMTTGNKVAVIGDFGNYCVLAERSAYSMRVLKELFATNNQTGFISTSRLDCTVTQPSAFSYLTMA